MLQIYRDKKDIHVETARKSFNLRPDEPVDPDMHRAPSKCINFGIAYGLAAPGLFAQLIFNYHFASKPVPSWLTEQWCEEFIERWFSTYPMVRGYMQRIYRMLRRYGFVWNEFGFVRQIHAIWSAHRHLQSEAERQAGNMPIQGFAAILMKLWMNLVLGTHEGEGWLPEWRELGECNPLLTVHDELNFETDPAIAELVKEVLAELVEFIGHELGLLCPLMAEGKTMDYWKK
jgi:DNA polymerase-1